MPRVDPVRWILDTRAGLSALLAGALAGHQGQSVTPGVRFGELAGASSAADR